MIRPSVVISNDHTNELATTALVMPITAGHYSYYHWIALLPCILMPPVETKTFVLEMAKLPKLRHCQ